RHASWRSTHGAGCPALSLRRSAESSLSLAARSTRRNPETRAPAEVPRRKRAEGRHQLASFFWLGRLSGGGSRELGGARARVQGAEVPPGRRVRLVELDVAAAAPAVVQLVGEARE